jgi:hypothetical protein
VTEPSQTSCVWRQARISARSNRLTANPAHGSNRRRRTHKGKFDAASIKELVENKNIDVVKLTFIFRDPDAEQLIKLKPDGL